MSSTPKYFPLHTLRTLRKKQHVTQSRLADYLNVSVQYYSQMERGINLLNYANACKLARFFNTTPDALFYTDYQQQNEKARTS